MTDEKTQTVETFEADSDGVIMIGTEWVDKPVEMEVIEADGDPVVGQLAHIVPFSNAKVRLGEDFAGSEVKVSLRELTRD
jgi:hypothetical protein